VQEDDMPRALVLVSLAARVAPRSPAIIDTLGWLKYRSQDRQGALALLQRAHDLNAADGEIGYHLAVALDATGKHASAKTLLQSVLARSLQFNDLDNAKQLLARW
jgi:Flp pilus assembly protein TadD